MHTQGVIDISVALGSHTGWPGDPGFGSELICKLADGAVADVTKLSFSVHAGTHVDAPAHFIPGGKKLNEYPPQRFVLPAWVVASRHGQCVQAEDLDAADVQPGQAVLFKTRNSSSPAGLGGPFRENYAYVSMAAADLCVRRGVSLVGLDYLGVDQYGCSGFPVHHKLLGADVLILETIDLGQVPAGLYTLICLPLKIVAEGSPVRAVLVP